MKQRLYTPAFFTLLAGHFLQALGYASMPLLPLYLEHLGASRTDMGTVMATSAISGLASRPFVGWALDSLGRRPTALLGTVLLASSLFLIPLVGEVGPFLYSIRLLFGLGLGTLFTGYFTMAADMVPAARRSEGIAIFGIAGLLPLAVNPIVGSLELPPDVLKWVFPLVGLLVLTSLLALWRLPERPSGGRGQAVLGPGAIVSAMVHPRLMSIWLANATLGIAMSVFLAFATVAADARGVGNPALLWFTFAGGAILVRLAGARIPDRMGPGNLVAPSLAAYGLSFVMLASAASPGAFLAAGVLAGFGHGYCFPVLASQLVDRVPEHLRGSSMAMFTAVFDLSLLVFNPLFGAVSDRWGDGLMFSSVAMTLTFALAIWGIMEHLLGNPPRALTLGSPLKPDRSRP